MRAAWKLAACALLLAAQPKPYRWDLPRGFPTPRVPADNPMTAAKVELGRYLFYDRRLSGNGSQSCATCHDQSRAFADGWPRGIGSTGQVHPRSTMSLANVAYSPVLTWANPLLTQLENQAAVPIFGDDPVEMGLEGKAHRFLEKARADLRYRTLFPAAFAGDRDPYTMQNVTRALASFQRTLFSGRSPYDLGTMSAAARRGEQLFRSDRLNCARCHAGFTFSSMVDHEGRPAAQVEYHNTALYLEYARANAGLARFTEERSDEGKFKAPTLRNIEMTAPYMHDGSVNTLEEVIDHYAAGGRAGRHPNRSPLLRGFALTPAEKADLVAFLKALTDREFLANPRFRDPWEE